MKTIALLVLGLLFINSNAQACMGGNLIQVMVGDEVVANYDVWTGKQIALAKSYEVLNVLNVTSSDDNWEPESLCTADGCKQLVQFKHLDVQFVVRKMPGKVIHDVFLSNVSVDPNLPRPRERAADGGKLIKYPCSIK